MKTKLLIAIFPLFLLQQLSAQDYIPIAVEGAHWIIRYDLNETLQPVDGLWEYFASGDTVINKTNYKKIYYRNLVITQGQPPFQADGMYVLYGLLRDDSINRKVYSIVSDNHKQCPNNEEYLLYDFSLQVGDTAKLCIMGSQPFIVEDISNEEVLGFRTKIFTYLYLYNQLYEGIGSNYGLYEEMVTHSKGKYEKYIFKTFLYYYCRETPCTLLVSTPALPTPVSLTISPNPAINSISISGDTRKEIKFISIYNQLGQNEMQINGSPDKIDISMLKHGFYIVDLKSNNNTIRKKLIIE